MNRIDVQKVRTVYDYAECYHCIDGRPIVEYIDEYVKNGLCPPLEGMGSMLGLASAWSDKLEWQWENDFVWELAQSREELNVPLLVCEEDNDLSCIVIVAHVRRGSGVVYWDRLGLLGHDSYNQEEANRHGILYQEAYTDEDWVKYGSGIALAKPDSQVYKQWVSENCYEEHIRQLRNYFKPYLQQDKNIRWIADTNWAFSVSEYESMLERFRCVRKNSDVQP